MKQVSRSYNYIAGNPTGFFTAAILCLLFFFPGKLNASGVKQKKENNWFVSGSTGIAVLTGEVTSNFNFLPNEFRHTPGFAYDLSAGRTMGTHWETALRVSAYTLFGTSNQTGFSAFGNHHALTDLLPGEPVEYTTQSTSVSLIFRYLFKETGRLHHGLIKFNPFIETGIGINAFTSELRYITTPDEVNSPLIFKKSDGNYAVGVAQFVTGVGTKIGFYKDWNAVILWNAEMVNYDSFDSLHNYSNGERNHAKGIVTRITAGISIPIPRQKNRDTYLPFRR